MPLSVRADREPSPPAPDIAVADGTTSARRRWYSGLTGMFGAKPAAPPAVADFDTNTNALLAFPSEGAARSTSPVATPTSAPSGGGAGRDTATAVSTVGGSTAATASARLTSRTLRTAGLVAATLLVGAAAGMLARTLPLRFAAPAPPPTGSLTIDTRPDGAEVLIDGDRRGVTPLRLTLAPGAHSVTVRNGSDQRILPLVIAAGSDMSQHLEMKTPEPVALFGKVSVVTDPPGARVSVDGRPRGSSPLVVADLTAEEHTVTVSSDSGSAERKVAVSADGTASVMFSLARAAGPVGGWLAISAPFDVEVSENNDVVGALGTTRIMFAAGRHEVMLTNRVIGFQDSRRIEITGGRTTAVRLDAPRVSISVNARPWADVVLDGASVGQTPISNLQVAIGSHEVVFKHPQLAERRQTIVVTAKGPNRIATDLTK
jgi:PEGA domain-containing protein